jgi:hypothetical protein
VYIYILCLNVSPLQHNKTMTTLVVHADDTTKKMALNGYSVHFVGYRITENVRRLWMNFISCVMVVRNPMRVNNNTIIILNIYIIKPTLMG